MDASKLELLDRLQDRLDISVDEVARALAAQSDAFGPILDSALHEELRQLARQHWLTFLETARSERIPGRDEYEFARTRAVQRARELVPLAAQVRAYLVGIRAVMDTVAQEAGPAAASRGAALELTGHLMDSVVIAFSTMVEAYVETVEGERADREADRWILLDEILNNEHEIRPELSRRAAGLGLDTDEGKVVVLANLKTRGRTQHWSSLLRRRFTAEAIGRATGRAAARTFIIVRPNDVIAVLDATGKHRAELVLDRARTALTEHYGGTLVAGVGTPFLELGGLPSSYKEALRALRHASVDRPIIRSPGDVSLFDDLTMSADASTRDLIPAPTQVALHDATLRSTLQAYIAANLSITETATTLVLHPNSVRYRLRRIGHLTGLDPRKLRDLLELASAARLIERDLASANSSLEDGLIETEPG